MVIPNFVSLRLLNIYLNPCSSTYLSHRKRKMIILALFLSPWTFGGTVFTMRKTAESHKGRERSSPFKSIVVIGNLLNDPLTDFIFWCQTYKLDDLINSNSDSPVYSAQLSIWSRDRSLGNGYF